MFKKKKYLLLALLISTNTIYAMRTSKKATEIDAEIKNEIKKKIEGSNFVKNLLALLNEETEWEHYPKVREMVIDLSEKVDKNIKNNFEKKKEGEVLNKIYEFKNSLTSETLSDQKKLEAFQQEQYAKAFKEVINFKDATLVGELKKAFQNGLVEVMYPFWTKKIKGFSSDEHEFLNNSLPVIMELEKIRDLTFEEYYDKIFTLRGNQEKVIKSDEFEKIKEVKLKIPKMAYVVGIILFVSNLVLGYLYYEAQKKVISLEEKNEEYVE